MNNKGTFIVVEGIDGAGKSTQIKNMVKYISSLYPDKKIILTREPGGTNNPLGEQIRELLLNNEMEDHTRTLLYAASRYEHQKKIQKWLEEGSIVICDRYIYSSMAYQAKTISDINEIMEVNRYDYIQIPDYIFHFDITFDTYLKRKTHRLNERELDELEKKGDEFFKKNIEMYETIYKYIIQLSDEIYDFFDINTKLPEIINIDSNKSKEEVKLQLQEEINKIFN